MTTLWTCTKCDEPQREASAQCGDCTFCEDCCECRRCPCCDLYAVPTMTTTCAACLAAGCNDDEGCFVDGGEVPDLDYRK